MSCFVFLRGVCWPPASVPSVHSRRQRGRGPPAPQTERLPSVGAELPEPAPGADAQP